MYCAFSALEYHVYLNHFSTRHSGRYHLKDVIVGKIYFLLVRIKIKFMELAIVKKEVTGAGASHDVRSDRLLLFVFLASFSVSVNCSLLMAAAKCFQTMFFVRFMAARVVN